MQETDTQDTSPVQPTPDSNSGNEIIIYQPDATVKLEVRLEDETVWLTQAQIVELFGSSKANISEHLSNIFESNELDRNSTVRKFRTVRKEGNREVTRSLDFFNLDVIISVGYRVNTSRGIQFRQWANKVLKDYMLKGYSVNQRLLYLENRIDRRLSEHDLQIAQLNDKMDMLVRTSLPPVEGIFFNGQIFDAHVFASSLVKSAEKRIVLIDNYIDETVLALLDKRDAGVKATIYTQGLSRQFRLDLQRHNRQYPVIDVKTVSDIHDRFLIVDDDLYHIGASIKDLGRKLFAFSKMGINPDIILNNI